MKGLRVLKAGFEADIDEVSGAVYLRGADGSWLRLPAGSAVFADAVAEPVATDAGPLMRHLDTAEVGQIACMTRADRPKFGCRVCITRVTATQVRVVRVTGSASEYVFNRSNGCLRGEFVDRATGRTYLRPWSNTDACTLRRRHLIESIQCVVRDSAFDTTPLRILEGMAALFCGAACANEKSK